MPTIIEIRYFTPIIEFEVIRNNSSMIDGISDEVERRFTRYAGFASVYASEDGQRVINYAPMALKSTLGCIEPYV